MAGKGRTSMFVTLLRPLVARRAEYVRKQVESFEIVNAADRVIGKFSVTFDFFGPGSWGYTFSGWYKKTTFADSSVAGFKTVDEANTAMRVHALTACKNYVKQCQKSDQRSNENA